MADRKRQTSPMVVIPYKEAKKRKTSMKKVRFDIPATTTGTSDDSNDDFTVITEQRERMPSPMVIIPYKKPSTTSNPSTTPNTKKNNAPIKKNGKKRVPTSFLDLPREIRQAILVLVKPSHRTWRGEKELMRKRSRILGEVHLGVERDMVFVEAVWRMEGREARSGEDEGGGVGKGLFGRRGGMGMFGMESEGEGE